jgi:hypothetical protein
MAVTYGYPTEEDKAKWPEIERLAKIEERKAQLMAEIKHLEESYNYSMLDGEIEWANQKKAQRAILKQELNSLK